MLVDPNGRSIWKPEVDGNGKVNYIAEQGDNAVTLAEQYGLPQEQAEAITGTEGKEPIKAGTKITGETVKKVTGSDVLKLDLTSSRATEQRRFDQLVFAIDRSKKDGFEIDPKIYFSNIKRGTTTAGGTGGLTGRGTIQIDKKNIQVHYSATVNWSAKLSNYPITISPDRPMPDGSNANAVIFNRSIGGGYGGMQLVTDQAHLLYDRLNKSKY